MDWDIEGCAPLSEVGRHDIDEWPALAGHAVDHCLASGGLARARAWALMAARVAADGAPQLPNGEPAPWLGLQVLAEMALHAAMGETEGQRRTGNAIQAGCVGPALGRIAAAMCASRAGARG